MDPGREPGCEPGLEPGFEPGLEPGFEPGCDPGRELGLVLVEGLPTLEEDAAERKIKGRGHFDKENPSHCLVISDETD